MAEDALAMKRKLFSWRKYETSRSKQTGARARHDAILISSQLNRLYASGFDYTDGYILITANPPFSIPISATDGTSRRRLDLAKRGAGRDLDQIGGRL